MRDIDIWVDSDAQQKVLEILCDSANKFNLKTMKPNSAVRLSGPLEGKYYIIDCRDRTDVVHLDFWSCFHWRGTVFIDNSVILSNTNRNEQGLWVGSQTLRAVISLVKDVLYKKEVYEKHRDLITNSLQSDPENFRKILNSVANTHLSDNMTDMIESCDWIAIGKKARVLRCFFFRQNLCKNPFAYAKRLLVYIKNGIKVFLFGKYKLFVTFIGPDGSGKTTIAKGVVDRASTRKLFEHTYYLHTKFPTLPPLAKIAANLGLISKASVERNARIARRLKPLPVWRSVIYPLYYGIGSFCGHFWVWKNKRRGGSLVVLDRYFYEYSIQDEFINCPRWLLKIIAMFIPKPDLLIYLKARPETIFERKQELPLNIISRQVQLCEQIVTKANNGVVIDNEIDSSEVIEKICCIIAQKIIAEVNKQ
jgi:thymidylate kinase